jgi:hypothetical protein
MKYKVHRLDINVDKEYDILQQFLNGLDGEVVSIIPNVRPFAMFYGSKVESVVIVEKVKGKK